MAAGRNPRDVKVMPKNLGALSYRQAAEDALSEFEARQGVLPDDMPEMMLPGAGRPLAWSRS